MSLKLSNLAEGKDNNFNLIRLIAALAVLFTHCFALVHGVEAQPLRTSLGMTFGTIAVDVFFVISGFLVTGSLFYRKSTREFLLARCLRIYPALFVMVMFSVFVIGLYFTTIPDSEFLKNRETIRFALKNSILFTGIIYELPGVFAKSPHINAVNGSLWTMPHEILMYAMLAFLWFILRPATESRLKVFRKCLVIMAVAALPLDIANHQVVFVKWHTLHLFFMFFSGAAYCVLKDHVFLNGRLFVFAVAGLLLATMNKPAFLVIYSLVIAYVVFYLAYVPRGAIRKFNQLGDYSYGTYLYAFPIQQSIVALIPGVTVVKLLVLSTIATLVLAVCSWHLVEKNALALKGRSLALSKRLWRFHIQPDKVNED
jgi:peptidoglycan/LPS O-acetylase OafA/YrhL